MKRIKWVVAVLVASPLLAHDGVLDALEAAPWLPEKLEFRERTRLSVATDKLAAFEGDVS